MKKKSSSRNELSLNSIVLCLSQVSIQSGWCVVCLFGVYMRWPLIVYYIFIVCLFYKTTVCGCWTKIEYNKLDMNETNAAVTSIAFAANITTAAATAAAAIVARWQQHDDETSK